ncbi:MAG: hypothetical protein UY07_C0011G0008 [Parcubacteria group bacterium GW2011_GWA1_47_8]|nr:MAG: hypothetical protein UY07_C0011G0008 [Parcubacteria group bacterium GW2011_GWA1_47_8]
MYTVDTNAVIYYLKGDTSVSKLFDEIIGSGARLYISTVTELELFSLPSLTNEEARSIDALLSTLTIIPLDSRLARLAGEIRRTYRIKTPDSIIAATALSTGTTLITKNTRDFKNIVGLTLHQNR